MNQISQQENLESVISQSIYLFLILVFDSQQMSMQIFDPKQLKMRLIHILLTCPCPCRCAEAAGFLPRPASTSGVGPV